MLINRCYLNSTFVEYSPIRIMYTPDVAGLKVRLMPDAVAE